MRNASRIAYAQARIQARFSQRPPDAFWRELEAGRDLQHLMELARATRAGAAVESVAATLEPHALEARLAESWAQTCDEIAGWYPPVWRSAMRWMAWLPWLPVLTWLARVGYTPSWMQAGHPAGLLGRLPPGERLQALAGGPLASLGGAWVAGESLSEAWHRQWSAAWPVAAPARERRALERLDAILRSFVPGDPDPAGAGFDALVEQAQVAATRVFRRQAGTPVAGMAMLVLLGLDLQRLRAALALARSFGPNGNA